MKELSVSDVAQWFAGLSEKQKFQVDREFHEITGGTLSAFAPPKPVAVALVPVATNEGLRLLGVRRGISPVQGKPALPGGFLEKDESPRAAAAREVHEEVGLDLPMKYFVEHGAQPTPATTPC